MSTRPLVLIIEDSHAIAAALRVSLSAAGYAPRVASDGLVGLAAAEAEPPAAVVLDVRMPGVDGFEVCRRLKQTPALRQVPVVFISANNVEATHAAAIEAGGVAFIPKPFDPDDVAAAIEAATRPLPD